MLKSMTGFGKASVETGEKKITVEIRTLNSKQADISFRLLNSYKSKEPELRNILIKHLERGKIDVILNEELMGAESVSHINKDIIKSYYKQIYGIAHELKMDTGQILQVIMRMPDVLVHPQESINDAEWKQILNAFMQAIETVMQFRTQEGIVIEQDIITRINKILNFLEQIGNYEKERIERIKCSIKQSLAEIFNKEDYDKNRFEQEMIYYLEKLDITEEKVRLANHCNYFLKIVEDECSQGRKLVFVTQEMSREINTIGSKANDFEIQRLVIMMKDELEKIKEQLMNVL
ncbi:MAG: YicC family protein [Bacteroidia bacterium]|nr:YicC family protein [Bacteroidia bacterium]